MTHISPYYDAADIKMLQLNIRNFKTIARDESILPVSAQDIRDSVAPITLSKTDAQIELEIKKFVNLFESQTSFIIFPTTFISYQKGSVGAFYEDAFGFHPSYTFHKKNFRALNAIRYRDETYSKETKNDPKIELTPINDYYEIIEEEEVLNSDSYGYKNPVSLQLFGFLNTCDLPKTTCYEQSIEFEMSFGYSDPSIDTPYLLKDLFIFKTVSLLMNSCECECSVSQSAAEDVFKKFRCANLRPPYVVYPYLNV